MPPVLRFAAVLGVCLANSLFANAESVRLDSTKPNDAIAFDSSRLIHSPHPYRAVEAFPGLDLGEKQPIQVIPIPGDESDVAVICRHGEVLRVRSSNATEDTLVDLRDRVSIHGEEQGLLGMAFHPDFENNGEVYLCYTTPAGYSPYSFRYDVLTAVLALLACVVGSRLAPSQMGATFVILSAALCVGVAVAFVLTPKRGISSDAKLMVAASTVCVIFLTSLFSYRLLMRHRERLARRVAGMTIGLMLVGCVSLGLTQLIARSLDSSDDSIRGSRTSRLQAQLLNRLSRKFPHRLSPFRDAISPLASRLVLSKFEWSEDRIDSSSEETLISLAFYTLSHHGGSIEFGPDRFLYVGIGDGEVPSTSQDLNDIHGKVLRLDVDRDTGDKPYSAPNDNPFIGNTEHPEIWAYGLRNPWRLAFDESGNLWEGDVGQNRFEEINLISRGGNYGWSLVEGNASFDASSPWAPAKNADTQDSELISPLISYDHRRGKAVVGGRVYRGERCPDLQGNYVYGDYLSGVIWSAQVRDGKLITNSKIAAPKFPISGFGEDCSGELLICALDGGIYRLEPKSIRTEDFPHKLSETGLFKSTSELAPSDGVIPYDVRVPLWSDGASKTRFVAFPATGRVEFAESAPWQFPEGTVFVKNFSLEDDEDAEVRLETRLWVHTTDGWEGYTYVWNEDQDDAVLQDAAESRDLKNISGHGNWSFLSSEQCGICHSKQNGYVLGFNTLQLNHGDQIKRLTDLGVFRDPPDLKTASYDCYPAWKDGSKNIDAAARAYLAVNCAVCHAPGKLGIVSMDLSYDTELNATRTIGVQSRRAKSGHDSARRHLIAAGRPDESELLRRLQTHNEDRMPPLASHKVDEQAVELLSRWIKNLP